MKKLIPILAIALTTSVHAKDNCIGLSELSETIMSNRQHGTDITKLVKLFQKPQYATMRPYVTAKAIEAYEEPRYSTVEYQDNAIADFKNEAYLECYKIINK
jgi:hypothetical protein